IRGIIACGCADTRVYDEHPTDWGISHLLTMIRMEPTLPEICGANCVYGNRHRSLYPAYLQFSAGAGDSGGAWSCDAAAWLAFWRSGGCLAHRIRGRHRRRSAVSRAAAMDVFFGQSRRGAAPECRWLGLAWRGVWGIGRVVDRVALAQAAFTGAARCADSGAAPAGAGGMDWLLRRRLRVWSGGGYAGELFADCRIRNSRHLRNPRAALQHADFRNGAGVGLDAQYGGSVLAKMAVLPALLAGVRVVERGDVGDRVLSRGRSAEHRRGQGRSDS